MNEAAHIDPTGRYILAPPAVPRPSIDVKAIEDMRKRTTLGMIKAVVGSVHKMTRLVEETIESKDPKDPTKTKSRKRNREEVVFRSVESIHAHRGVDHRFVCLSCSIVGDTEEDLLSDHYAVHGSEKAMAAKGFAHVYCAETLAPVEINAVAVDPKNGRGASTVKSEIVLLSDRESTG